MKIAILADIHGNLTAFDKVVNEITSIGIDKIIIAGDSIGDGPQPNEVINRIKKLNPWIIKGNREEYTLNYFNGLCNDWTNSTQMAATVWTTKNINKENLRYIGNLPEQLTVKLCNKKLRIVHGSPHDIYEHLYPNHHIERLNRAISSIEEEILICGHTHEQWYKILNSKLVINPGSVGVHYNKFKCAEYAILTINNDSWNIEHKLLQYDLNELENKFKESGLYNFARAWSRLTLQSMTEGEIRTIEFLKFANNLAKQYGLENLKLIPNNIWDEAEKLWYNQNAFKII